MIGAPVRLGAGTRVLGFGAALPSLQIDAAELGRAFGKDAAWIAARTGIRRLGRVTGPEELASLVQLACDDALAAAAVEPTDVDLVITTSCSASASPWTAGRLAAGIAKGAGRMDLNSACSGFCYSLAAADSMIRSGTARTVLVVGAERMSSLVDPADLGTSIIFGDGAGAAVVGPATGAGTGVGPVVWGSDGAQAGLIDCGCEPGGMLAMAGRQVFRWAVERMPAIATEACARAGVTLEDIDVFVPHQANLRIVDAIVDRLGLGAAVVADSVTSCGNTSAASIPIALTDLARSGRLRSGQRALLLGFGAGLSYAGQVVELP